MGSLLKIIAFLVIQGSVFALAEDEWGRVAADFFNMNVVCGQCDDLCPRTPYSNAEDGRRSAAHHWACYIGCRTTCLLQVGPDKYDYDTAKNLCVKGCHDLYKTISGNENLFSRACIDACAGKVVTPKTSATELTNTYAQLDFEETETILFDPSLGLKTEGLPRSSYKTLPHKDSLVMYNSIRRQLGKPTNLDNFITLIKDSSNDPTLAGAVAIPLILLLFGTMCYLVYIVSIASKERKNRRHRSPRNCNQNCNQQPITVLQVDLQEEDDDKKNDSTEYLLDDEFVPPATPPPKYSDIVETV